MRKVRFGLLVLLIAGVIVLIVGHSISTEEIIDSIEGEKVVVTTMTWDGKEVIFDNLNGPKYGQEFKESGKVRLFYTGKLRIRQSVSYEGKKMRAKYNQTFSQSNGYDIELSEDNRNAVYTLYATPHWDVTRRNILFWKMIGLKKKYLSFSYDEQRRQSGSPLTLLDQ